MKPKRPEKVDMDVVMGQFPSDNFFFPGDPRLDKDPLGVKAMRGQGKVNFHFPRTLFDEVDGESDELTGKRIGHDPLAHLTEIEGMDILPERVVLGRAPVRPKTRCKGKEEPEIDPADKWMKQNGHKW